MCEAEEIEVITGLVENGFGISILPYMDIVRLHHITAIPVQTSSWKSKFYIARKKIRNPHSAGRGVFSALEEMTGRKFYGIVKQNLSEKVRYKMISEKIFELILRNGMTQKEFSEETGISQSTISDWKRKGTNPSADKILKICEV